MSKNTSLPQTKTNTNIKNKIRDWKSPDDPDIVLQQVGKLLDQKGAEKIPAPVGSPLFKAISLLEFENMFLLGAIVPELYKTFAIGLFQQLKEEYHCISASEKATAELAALSYVRMMELQRKIDGYLESKTMQRAEMEFFSMLSKDLDRATRQYVTAIQMLRMLKQPPLHVNINTHTAIVGHNQAIQENQYDNTSI